jgi:bifunctional UDP-N-acetylglucosamine pyrophosphorylase/glucosamine-1-phosphate N-acetyltransferase
VKKNSKIKIVILAAGKGTRMKSELPKVLTDLRGKPMIKHLLESVSKSGVDENPVIVVGHKKELVIEKLNKDNRKYIYAVQEEQLGTGHAVMSAEEVLKDIADYIIVLPSDHPFLSAETIKKLAEKHLESQPKITMVLAQLPDFKGWRSAFYTSFSRIVRDTNGKIIKDVQFRDASDEEKKITEVNPMHFCFDAGWLWQKLKTLKTDNDQKQYLLTDLIKIAMQEGEKIEYVYINPREALAANSKEELEILEKLEVK